MANIDVNRAPNTDGPEEQGPLALLEPLQEPQTYLNLLYLLLAFPLGIVYFVFLTTGFSLAAGLLIVFVGLPIFVGVLAGSLGFAALERELAVRLLGVEIPRVRYPASEGGFWPRVRALLTSPRAWVSVVYLFLRFPLGIASFTVVVSLVAGSVGLILTPLFYTQDWWQVSIPGLWEVKTFSQAVATSIIGVLVGVASVYALNGLAWLSGQIARAMLGGTVGEEEG